MKFFRHILLKKNEDIDYYATIGNTGEKEEEYLVILLEDWEQKELFDNKDSIVVSLPEDHKITLPIKTSFETPGSHEITVLRIANCYQEIDPYSFDVEAANTLWIDIK